MILATRTTSPDGQWLTDIFTDGTTVTYPAPGSAVEVAMTNAQTLRDKASQSLAANATFLAVASPSNAQIATQVRALTRQVNAVLRLLVVGDTSTITDS